PRNSAARFAAFTAPPTVAVELVQRAGCPHIGQVRPNATAAIPKSAAKPAPPARAWNERAQEHHSGRPAIAARDHWLAVLHRQSANGATTPGSAAQTAVATSARIPAIGDTTGNTTGNAAIKRRPVGNAGSPGNAKSRRPGGPGANR